jgi:O-antigen/teichoic acid export membrane protein
MLLTLKQATKNSIIYGLGNLSIKLIGLILFPIYTQQLSLTEYGILGIIEVSTQLFIAFFGLSLYSAFFRYYWDQQFVDKKKSMLFNILIILLLSIGIMFIITIPLSTKISRLLFDTIHYQYLVTLMIISAGLQILNNVPATLIRLQEKPVLYSVANIVRLVITLVLTIYFIVYLGRDLNGIYEAQIIGQIAYSLFLLRFIIRNLYLKYDKYIIKVLLAFSFPLVFSSVSGILLNVTDRYCLKFLTELSDVGLYSAGYKIASAIAFIISAGQLAITPMIYKKIDDPDSKRFYSKIMTYFTYAVMIMVIGLSIFGKEVIKVLSQNADYWDSYRIIPIISFSVIFSMLGYTSITGLSIIKKTNIIATITIIISIINLGLNLLFIPFFESIGAAIATLLTQLIYFISVYYYSQKYYHIPYETGKVVKMIITGLVIILIAIPVNELNLLMRILIKTILVCSYPFLLYFLNFYEQIELERIKGAWNKWKNLKNIRKNILRF